MRESGLTALARAGATQDLAAGETAYFAGRYERALSILDELAERPGVDDRLRVRALKYSAFSHLVLGSEAQAKAAEGDEAEKIQETVFLRQRIRERLVERIADLEKKVGD